MLVPATQPASSAAQEGAGESPGDDAEAGDVGWPWPEEDSSAGECVYRYPDDLPDRANAFDATVVDVQLGKYSDDAGARPATVTVAINEVFRGPQEGTAVLKTWDFSLPPDPRRAVGARILAAAGPTMDLMGCGFTRPYTDAEAGVWRDRFSSAADDPGVALRRCVNERSGDERIEAAFTTTAEAVHEWADERNGPAQEPENRIGRAEVSLCYFRGAYAPSVPAGVTVKYRRRVAMVPSGSKDPTLFLGAADHEPTAPPGAARVDDR